MAAVAALSFGLSLAPPALADTIPLSALIDNPTVQAAPAGKPGAVAMAAIREQQLPCARITWARRTARGAIDARCQGGERYLVFTVRGYPGVQVSR